MAKENSYVTKTGMILRGLAVAMLAGMLGFCCEAASTIHVHLIDARSGMPMANAPVRLWTTGVAEYRDHPGYVQQTTDANGVATFHVPDPAPTYLYVHPGMGDGWRECSVNNRTGYVAKDVLASGVSTQGFCEKLPDISGKFHPGAGDIYIFVTHQGFWERIRMRQD
jgi:hypothetical protein